VEFIFYQTCAGLEGRLCDCVFNVWYSFRVRQGGRDSIWWMTSKWWNFEVKLFYQMLSIPASSSIPFKSIWRVKVSSRVCFYVWTTALVKILPLDNLKKRKVIVLGWCYMCKRSRESIDLLLHCQVAREL